MKSSKLMAIGIFCVSAFGLMKCVNETNKTTDITQQQNISSLTNTNWKIQSGEISFDHNAYYADLGCNRLSGQFTQTGDKISIIPGAMTKMGCPQEHPENKFLRDFKGLFTISQDGDEVILSRDSLLFHLN